MFEGEVNAFSLDGTTSAQIQIFDAVDRTRTGNGMFTNMTTPPLDGAVVLRMMRLADLNDVANDLNERLVIKFAQVGTAREAESGELRTEGMIDGVVECCRDESWGLLAGYQCPER